MGSGQMEILADIGAACDHNTSVLSDRSEGFLGISVCLDTVYCDRILCGISVSDQTVGDAFTVSWQTFDEYLAGTYLCAGLVWSVCVRCARVLVDPACDPCGITADQLLFGPLKKVDRI